MKFKQGSIFIILGTMLLLVALSIILCNINDDINGGTLSNDVSQEIKSQLPDISYATVTTSTDVPTQPSLEDEVRNQYQNEELEPNISIVTTTTFENPTIYINGDYYIGIITIPSLNLELPILNNLTNKNLKKSPCVYSGDFQNNDLIIAGHNYRSHFGKLQNLNDGDKIYITDINGVVYQYEVTQLETISGNDTQTMKSNLDDWDLTLFTCTLSGKSRVTIRATRI